MSAAAASGAAYSTCDASQHAAWDKLRTAYLAARAAETAHDAANINIPDDLPIGPERNALVDRIPQAAWTESERLQEIRWKAEDSLFELPSPHAAAFALKVFICRERSRDLNGMDDELEREARQFAGLGDVA